jgi:hypothetical protein
MSVQMHYRIAITCFSAVVAYATITKGIAKPSDFRKYLIG